VSISQSLNQKPKAGQPQANSLGSNSMLRPALEDDMLRTNSESGTMQRFSFLNSAAVRRMVLTLALIAPVAMAGSALAQQSATPDAPAPRPPPKPSPSSSPRI
jgi:hypothetical protein